MSIQRVAIIGAGTMGSGIAQKVASVGLSVTLVDTTQELAEAGKARIEHVLVEGLERGVYEGPDVDAILGRVLPTIAVGAAADADLVIEAVYEDREVKRALFKELGAICPPGTILATNTSSFLVSDFADAVSQPSHLVGLHYFFHPAKNRLVEVVGHADTDPEVLRRAWAFQQLIDKTPIASADAPGFVVNRFFGPWVNEAARLHEEGHSVATIEAAAKAAFGVGMGPFELMNATGPRITLHAAQSLGERLGAFYAPAEVLLTHVDAEKPWDTSGRPKKGDAEAIGERMWGAVLHAVFELLSDDVGTAGDVDIGARVGLRWPLGPIEHVQRMGKERAAELAMAVGKRYGLEQPRALADLADGGDVPEIETVRLSVSDGIATLQLNRPDRLNALDPATLRQLDARFEEALGRDDVEGIVIAGAGKAFVAGADVRFFVDRLSNDAAGEVVEFADFGQKLFRRIEKSPKRVVCRLHGMALGGGAELALACHAVVATPRATMGFPETGIGIYPGLGGTQRLTRRLGRGVARYLLYTGKTLSAEELMALSLVWRVVPSDELDQAVRSAVQEAPVQPPAESEAIPAALRDPGRFLGAVPVEGLLDGSLTLPGGVDLMEIARTVRRKAPNALRSVATLTELAEEDDLDAGLAAETDSLKMILHTADALEGMRALLEGRRPKFTGS